MTSSRSLGPPCRRQPRHGRTHPAGRERVELLLAEMTLEEKVAQLGSRWVGNDAADDGGAGSCRGAQPDDGGRSTSPRCRTCSPRRAPRPGGGQPSRARPPHPDLRQRPAHRRAGGGGAGAAAAGGDGVFAAGHSGAGARGVPDRVHHLRRDGLPDRARLGGHLRPRSRRADGGRDRRRHGRARHAPGTVPRAGRGPRLPLGPGRGDHRRGPVPGRDARRGLRPRAAEHRRARHAEALRRATRPPAAPATTARSRWGAAN